MSIADYRELKHLEIAQTPEITRYSKLQESLHRAFSGNVLPGGRLVQFRLLLDLGQHY